MDRWEIYFRWLMNTNQDALSMGSLRTKAEQSETAVNYDTRDIYKTGKSGSWKTWHGIPHANIKRGGNIGRIYTSTDSPGAYRNKKSER